MTSSSICLKEDCGIKLGCKNHRSNSRAYDPYGKESTRFASPATTLAAQRWPQVDSVRWLVRKDLHSSQSGNQLRGTRARLSERARRLSKPLAPDKPRCLNHSPRTSGTFSLNPHPPTPLQQLRQGLSQQHQYTSKPLSKPANQRGPSMGFYRDPRRITSTSRYFLWNCEPHQKALPESITDVVTALRCP